MLPLARVLRGLFTVLLCCLLAACGGGTPAAHIAEARRILDENKGEIRLVRTQARRLAVAELKQALKKDGENLEAALLLADTFYHLGDLEDADRWLEKALELGADPADVTPLRAELLLVTDELQKLDNLPFDGLTPEGRSTVQAAKAVSLLEQGKPELAAETLEAALENETLSPFAEVAAARISMAFEGYEAALRKLVDIIKRYPDYAPAWKLVGDVESARGQAKQALDAYVQYMYLAGPRAEALMNAALMKVFLGNSRRARAELNQLEDNFAWVLRLDSFRYLKGLALMGVDGKLYSARKSFVREVKDAGAYPQSHYLLAVLNLELGLAGEEPGYAELALSHAYEFLRYVPESAAGVRLAAKLEMARGKYKNAERLLRPLLRRQPDDLEGLSLMARTLVGLERLPEAIEVLDRLVELQPESLVARARLGAAYLGAGSERVAIPAWWELLEPDPEARERVVETEGAEQVLAKRPDEQDILDVPAERERSEKEERTDLLTTGVPPGPDAIVSAGRRGATGSLIESEQLGIRLLNDILNDNPGFEQADILLVLNHLRQRRVADALAAARSYRERNPSGAMPYVLLGRALLANNDREMARQAFANAVELRPGIPGAGSGLAEIALLEKDHAAARDYYEEILVRHPGHTESWMGIAATFAAQGREQEMLETLERAVSADPRALAPRLAVVRYHLARGNLDEVKFLLRGFTEEEAEQPEALEALALAGLADGRYDHAQHALQKLLRQRPDNAQYHYLLAKTYAGVGDSRRMVAALEHAAGLAPGHFYARLAGARLEYESGRFEEFHRLFEELRGVAPEHPEVMRLEALSLQQGGDSAGAGRVFAAVYSRQPVSENLIALAVNRHGLGDSVGAIQLLREWLEDHPDDIAARERLAEYYSRGGQAEQAKREYRKIVQLNPDHAPALNNLAWHLLDEDPEDALNYAERALLAGGGSSAMYDTLAMAQLKTNKLAEARRSIGRALELEPRDPVLRSHEAEIRAAEGSEL